MVLTLHKILQVIIAFLDELYYFCIMIFDKNSSI